MRKNFTMSDYAAIVDQTAKAVAEAERLKGLQEEMTEAVLSTTLSQLAPGEGMTARQISQSIDGVLDSQTIAQKLSRSGKYVGNRQRVVMYYRETTADGELIPNTPLHTTTRRVNVYHMI